MHRVSESEEVDVVHPGRRFAVSTALAVAICLAGAAGLGCEIAAANDCAARCYAQENACRRATQGAQSCDAALTRCLQACRTKR
ncbi:MAG TPA: hypothetical protein VJ045_05345 [Hyphomicrobiaceae bacterium]|nr:hypothetical protein [Hyphomicrobiaceae bacterium]